MGKSNIIALFPDGNAGAVGMLFSRYSEAVKRLWDGGGVTTAALRDELDLRRRHLLNALDYLTSDQLHGRVGWQRHIELLDQLEQQIADLERELLRQLEDMEAKL